MARYQFGSGPEDYVSRNGRPWSGVTVTFWTAKTGGTQVTDLLAEDGVTPITSVTSDADGGIGSFYGPDNVVALWALAGGARKRIEAWDQGDLGGGGEGAVSSVNGRVGAVTGLAEASALTAETTARTTADTALDGRVSTVETALPLKADSASVSAALSSKLDTSALAPAIEAERTTERANQSATYQPLDSDLTAIAALSTTAFGRGLLALADAAAGRTALGLGTAATTAASAYDAAGSAAAAQAASQPLDSDLTALAALSTTAYGRAFLTLADGPALRAVLGTGTPSSTTYLRGDGTWATPAGGGSTPTLQARGMKSGRAYPLQEAGQITSTGPYANMTLGRVYAVGLLRPKAAVTIDRWGYFVDSVAGSAGCVIRCGLWLVGDDGMPTTLAHDLGSGVGDVTNADYQITCSAALTAGVEYVVGMVAQGGSVAPKLAGLNTSRPSWFGVEGGQMAQIYRYGQAYGLASDGMNSGLTTWPTTYVTGSTDAPRTVVRIA